jgi:cell division protease FtsH
MDDLLTGRATDDPAIVRFLEARRFTDLPTDWSAVIGHEHAKRELRVAAAALARRDLAERLGVPLVKGILITGPSGIGKTLLARAFAGSVDRPVFVLSAADLGPRRIRRIYAALADVPCVLIIDEIDLIAPRSWNKRDKRAAALCIALDGIVPVSGPITLGLTAEPSEDLDQAVIRSGRLGTRVVLELPEREDRRALWELYLADLPTQGPIDLEMATDRSQGMTGADIAAAARAAAGLSLADGLEALDAEHLEEALDRRGTARRPSRDDAEMRRAVAIHEAGHALFAFAVLGADALNSAVIARSGRGEGHVSLRAEWGEAHALDGRHWRDLAALSLAGLAAEQIVLGGDRLTFGSRSDVGEATEIVLRAAENGLLKAFGRASPDRIEEGREGSRDGLRGSEAMRASLWNAVHAEIAGQEARARDVLQPHRAAIEALAEKLLQVGSLAGATLIAAIRDLGVPEATTRA